MCENRGQHWTGNETYEKGCRRYKKKGDYKTDVIVLVSVIYKKMLDLLLNQRYPPPKLFEKGGNRRKERFVCIRQIKV